MNESRANLYQALAEALAEPPEWLASQGTEWPLFEVVCNLAQESEAAQKAIPAMISVTEESPEQRQSRYAALFNGPNRPQIWIYESGALLGRLFSEITVEVEQWYRAAALNVVGSELPDHASLELSFLAHLAGAEQLEFSRFEKEFLDRHALRWLPALGRALASSGDMVYAPIGQLLTDWLDENNPHRPNHKTPKKIRPHRSNPEIQPEEVESCILCGFCSQTCPTGALVMRENEQLTSLQLSAQLCVGCGLCVRVCEPHVLRMLEKIPARQERSTEWVTLRNSARSVCTTCGKPLISQAELAYVAACLGDPTWLELCQDCRPGFF